jgi:hypothetical protein
MIESQISLKNFSLALMGGNSSELEGIYVNGVLALRVVQQPLGQPGFVSSLEGVVTQFALARKFDVIGLLAHNYSSGSLFFSLRVGDSVILIFGDGAEKELRITDVDHYQALSATDPYSDFINLENGALFSAEQMFYKYYTGKPHLTLQTCIQKGNQTSWGRLFVIAQDIP